MHILDLRLHKLGLIALAAPGLAASGLALALFVAVVGASRLTIDTSLTRLFHGGTTEYQKLSRLAKAYPASEYDVTILIEGETIFEAGKLDAIRDLHLEARLIGNVQSVVSIFSVRAPLRARGEPDLIVPDDLTDALSLAELEAELLANQFVKGRLLSPRSNGRQATVIAVSFKSGSGVANRRDRALMQLRAAAGTLDRVGLKWTIGGVPIARAEMLSSIENDFIVLNSAGFAIGLSICFLFFRRPRYVFIAGICPFAAALLSGGIMGLAGIKINPLMTAIPLLIMAVTFTDAMHLLYAIKSRLEDGADCSAAVDAAVREVGPACVLASATTSTALFSLMLSNSPLVMTFGLWAGIANLASVTSLLLLLPLLANWLLRSRAVEPSPAAPRRRRQLPDVLSSSAAQLTMRWPRSIVVLSMLATVLLAWLYAELTPTYRLSDQLPRGGDFRYVTASLDRHLAGANQLFVLVDAGPSSGPATPAIIPALRATHALLAANYQHNSVLSALTLFGEAGDLAKLDDQQIAARLRQLPPGVLSRLIDMQAGTAVISLQFKNLDAHAISTFAAEIEATLRPVVDQSGAVKINVTGMPLLLAREAPKIVAEINQALLAAFILVFVLIGLAFRSLKIAVVSLIPNLLPVLTAGALAYVVVGGLDYASVIGLTVAFGLAVDDSAHFLNRFVIESGRDDDVRRAVKNTIEVVAPVLIVTTIILLCALAVTVFSMMPPTETFGLTCVATLLAALLADLFVLPSTILVAQGWSASINGKATSAR